MHRNMKNEIQPDAGRRGILKMYFETTTIKGVPKVKQQSFFLSCLFSLFIGRLTDEVDGSQLQACFAPKVDNE